MLSQTLPGIRTDRWMGIFIFIHMAAWTLIPYFVRYTLPLDAMEGATWGHQLEWGYDKNPFLNGWLTALAVYLDGHSGFVVYLLSQICVGICFWAVWQLAKKMLPPVYALVAVLLLEGIQYYNVHSIDFNDNTLELALWALTSLCFYNALKSEAIRDWLLTGLVAGLGMMAKYYTAILLIPMALFLVTNRTGRHALMKPGLYLGLMVFIAVITPHLIWLFAHDFVTVNYAMERVSSLPTWSNHFIFPSEFSWQQFQAFLPPLILILLLFVGDKPKQTPPRIRLSVFDKRFLFYVGIGPFLLTILLSTLTGIKLRAGWGTPLLSLWGIILISWLQPHITPARFYRFLFLFFMLLGATVLGYATALIRASEPSSANFPGKFIAQSLTREWHRTYHSPLPYVAGSRWFAGNIAFYSPDRPTVYIDWNKKMSPWIDETEFNHKGAIFVWDNSEKKKYLSPEVLARFKHLGPLRIMHFSWLRNRSLAPIEMTVAFLPPDDANEIFAIRH
ncbi:MAG: glycosyltransferase family 39 protein [Gammaproteobacteria bacterium]|nr:glycosyltransferase family 39 protein [Gammaproteobacteria bacterium]